jgi:hypothetical protein
VRVRTGAYFLPMFQVGLLVIKEAGGAAHTIFQRIALAPTSMTEIIHARFHTNQITVGRMPP